MKTTKSLRNLLAAGVITLAFTANTVLAGDVVKGAGKQLELIHGDKASPVTFASTVNSSPTKAAVTLKGASRQLELSRSKVVTEQAGHASTSSSTKPVVAAKGANRQLELISGARSPEFRIAPVK